MSPADRRAQLRDKYGFEFPDNLFHFWDFAKRLRPLEPLRALEEVAGVLVGPFDVLYGLFDGRSPRYSPLLHWRYYLDPPEFFTVLLGSCDSLHWGYVLDDPTTGAGCVASYYANDTFEMSVDGDTLFEAVRLHLEHAQADAELDLRYGLVSEEETRRLLLEVDRVRRALMRHATGKRRQTGEAYTDRYCGRSARRRRVVATTKEHLGVVVSPDQYRPLSLPDRELRRLLRQNEDPVEVVAEARRALADGFPGTALKLGKELWATATTGPRLEYARELLDAAYVALNRPVLRTVLREHLAHRDRPWLDVLQPEET
jgi:hypothetical protein